MLHQSPKHFFLEQHVSFQNQPWFYSITSWDKPQFSRFIWDDDVVIFSDREWCFANNTTKERQTFHWFLLFANNRGKEVCQHSTEKLDLRRFGLLIGSSRSKEISQTSEPSQSKTNSIQIGLTVVGRDLVPGYYFRNG